MPASSQSSSVTNAITQQLGGVTSQVRTTVLDSGIVMCVAGLLIGLAGFFLFRKAKAEKKDSLLPLAMTALGVLVFLFGLFNVISAVFFYQVTGTVTNSSLTTSYTTTVSTTTIQVKGFENCTSQAIQPNSSYGGGLGAVAGKLNFSMLPGTYQRKQWTIFDAGSAQIGFNVTPPTFSAIPGTVTPTVRICPLSGVLRPNVNVTLNVTVFLPASDTKNGTQWYGFASVTGIGGYSAGVRAGVVRNVSINVV